MLRLVLGTFVTTNKNQAGSVLGSSLTRESTGSTAVGAMCIYVPDEHMAC